MMADVGGGSDRMRVAHVLASALNAFGHARANAAGCAVMAKYPTTPLSILLCTDDEQVFRYPLTFVS